MALKCVIKTNIILIHFVTRLGMYAWVVVLIVSTQYKQHKITNDDVSDILDIKFLYISGKKMNYLKVLDKRS